MLNADEDLMSRKLDGSSSDLPAVGVLQSGVSYSHAHAHSSVIADQIL